MDQLYFILPKDFQASYKGGDTMPVIDIGSRDGNPGYRVTADSVVNALCEVEHLRATLRTLSAGLEAERGKIRRLMRALSDEVTKG